MSFSDKRVADLVNSKFVAAWINRGPGFNNTEFWTEQGIVERNYEAYPTKNICTFFLTPEGKVFYYVAGSYSPDLFLKILETAGSLRTALFDEKMQPKEKGRSAATALHEDRADAYDDLKDRCSGEGWKALVKTMRPVSYRGIKHVHNDSCGWSLKNGYEYLAALHRDWQGRKELPSFEDVRFQYLYGNDFTEETAESHITAPPKPEEPVAKRLRAKPAETQTDKDLFGISRPGFNLMGK